MNVTKKQFFMQRKWRGHPLKGTLTDKGWEGEMKEK